jgi:hypothetical protein
MRDVQFKSKRRILFIAIICLFCFQFSPEPSVATNDMPSQNKIEAQTVKTMSTQSGESNLDDVLAFRTLVLKLRPGFGCAEDVDESSYGIPAGPGGYLIYRRNIASHLTFKITEFCFGNPKGPDIKRDFKWFMIADIPDNTKVGYNILPPGLVLSLFPNRYSNVIGPSNSGAVRYLTDGVIIKKKDRRFHWEETIGRLFVNWSLIEKLPKFTIVGLKNHRSQKNESFKWQEKVYDCADLEKLAPPGFRRVFEYYYCWFEKTTGPDILHDSFEQN